MGCAAALMGLSRCAAQRSQGNMWPLRACGPVGEDMLQLSGWDFPFRCRPATDSTCLGRPVLVCCSSSFQVCTATALTYPAQAAAAARWVAVTSPTWSCAAWPDCHTLQAWHFLCCGRGSSEVGLAAVFTPGRFWNHVGVHEVMPVCTTSPMGVAAAAAGDSETPSDPPGHSEVAPASMATPGTPDVPLLPMSTPLYQTDSAGGLDAVPAPAVHLDAALCLTLLGNVCKKRQHPVCSGWAGWRQA